MNEINKITKFVIKWIMIFLITSVIAFVLPRLMPNNPVQILLESMQVSTDAENIKLISEAWGLNRPLYEQYFGWIINFVKGDWGQTLLGGVDIKMVFLQKIPYTFAVGFGGIFFCGIISFFLGYGAAINDNGIVDKISRGLSLFSMSIPSFVTTVVIVYFFGVKLGVIRFFTGNLLCSMAIAVAVLALYTAGPVSRVVKIQFQKEMAEAYIIFAISRGFSPNYVLLCHGYKPVLCSMISVMVSKSATILGGSTVLEYSLGIPGINLFLVQSMQATDYNVLQVYIMFIVIGVFILHLCFSLMLKALNVRGAQ
ncbi:MAG: ABC transporter permease [Anaerotignaceae bacterium]